MATDASPPSKVGLPAGWGLDFTKLALPALGPSAVILSSLGLALVLTGRDAALAGRYGLDFAGVDALHLVRIHGLTALALGLVLECAGLLGAKALGRFAWLGSRPRVSAALGGALLAAPGAWWLATALSHGEWIAAQRWVVGFRVGAALGLLGAGAAVGWAAAQRDRWFVRAGGAALAALLLAADSLLLVGLYAQLHVGLHLSGIAIAWLSLAPLLTFRRLVSGPRRVLFIRLLPLAAVLVGLGYASAAWAPLPSQARALRLSPALRSAILPLMPPADVGLVRRVIASQQETARRGVTSAKKLRTERVRNVLLIVIDTLRADALPPVRNASSAFRDEDTPFLNGWLESAYRYDTAYAAANATRLSMPATFESRWAFEVNQPDSIPLGERAAAAGLETYALVPSWYFGIDAAKTSLLDGFDDVRTNPSPAFRRFASESRAVLKKAKGRPFFALLHYLGMHAPYDVPEPHPADSGPQDQYRAALRELDRQLAEIMADVRAFGLERDTLIVLMSDHGELLGEQGRQHHGHTLFDAETHVPLAFWIPGVEPRASSELVGNIDIIPTIFDLLGQPADDARGRSLAPTMAGGKPDPFRSYYVVSREGSQVGLVTGRRSLVHDKGVGSFSVYQRSDTMLRRDELGLDPLADLELLDTFVEMDPTLFARELAEPATQALLAERLDDLTLEEDSRALEVLARFASVTSAQEPRQAAVRAFERTRSAAAKRRLFVEMARAEPQTWTKLGLRELEQSKGAEEEKWLSTLTRARAPLADERLAVRRLEALEDCRAAASMAWLGYLATNTLGPSVVPALSDKLTCARTAEGKLRRQMVLASLDALAAVRGVARPGRLESRLLGLTKGQHPTVVASAVRALGAMGGERASERLRELVQKHIDARITIASLVAIARIEGSACTPYLIEVGEKGGGSGVVKALLEAGDARALPLLEKWHATARGANGHLIGQAIEAIRSRTAP